MSTEEATSDVKAEEQGGGEPQEKVVPAESNQPKKEVDAKLEVTAPDQPGDGEQVKRMAEYKMQPPGSGVSGEEDIPTDQEGRNDGSTHDGGDVGVDGSIEPGETTEQEEQDDSEMQERHFQEGDDHGEEYHTEELAGSEGYEEMEEGGEQSMENAADKLQTMVNEVLEKKMEGFQFQMQQMLAMIQNVASKASPEKPVVGESSKSGEVSVVGQEAMSQPSQGPPVKTEDSDAREAQRVDEIRRREQQSHLEQEKFGQFLKTICKVLDIPMPQKEKSLLDDTVSDDHDQYPSYLPIEGLLKNSWQKVEGKYLNDCTRNLTNQSYPWGAEDMYAFGELAHVNEDLQGHLKQKKYKNGGSKDKYLRMESDVKRMEGLFRYQQRIMSYASYFLAALGKSIGGEADKGAPSMETISEIMKNLSQCIVDTCDAAVQGCVFTTKVRRRMYLNALEVERRNAHLQCVNLPLSKRLFPANIGEALQEHGVDDLLQTAKNQQKGAAGSQQSPRGNQVRGNQGQGNHGRGSQGQGNQGRGNQRQGRQGRGRQGNQGQGNRPSNQAGGSQGGQQYGRRNRGQRGQGQGQNQNNQRRGPQQQSSNKRRPASDDGGRYSGDGRMDDLGWNGQGRRLSGGSESDSKRRRPLDVPSQSSRLDNYEEKMRSPLGFSDASFNIGRFTSGRSSGALFDYDSLLSGSGRSPSSTHPMPLPSLGGGYRSGVSPSLLASTTPLDSRSRGYRGGLGV